MRAKAKPGPKKAAARPSSTVGKPERLVALLPRPRARAAAKEGVVVKAPPAEPADQAAALGVRLDGSRIAILLHGTECATIEPQVGQLVISLCAQEGCDLPQPARYQAHPTRAGWVRLVLPTAWVEAVPALDSPSSAETRRAPPTSPQVGPGCVVPRCGRELVWPESVGLCRTHFQVASANRITNWNGRYTAAQLVLLTRKGGPT